MDVIRVMPNLYVDDVEEAKRFYADFLGLRNEEFNLGWVARLTDTERSTIIQLVTSDASAPVDSVISVHTRDVEAAYEEALEKGYEIVVPLTREQWGVHRFFVRAPDGNVINIVGHAD
jgi:catechol 2,3-dioxygenase-like lactoylglutathione lyase family enzyme